MGSVIEPSKSSRALCGICKKKIVKETPRVGEENEFKVKGKSVSSMKWYHLECSLKNMPDIVLSADVNIEVEIGKTKIKKIRLSEDDLLKIKELKYRYSRSRMTLQSISDITIEDKVVNVNLEVFKQLSQNIIEQQDVNEMFSIVYVRNSGTKSKILLWDEHSLLKLSKGDRLVIIKGEVKMGINGSIEIHANFPSKVLVNPDDDEINTLVEFVDLYVSKAWNRPKGKIAEFKIAPSSRAMCRICEENIEKGDLKIVKPEFIEISEQDNKIIPGDISFHLDCIMDDEHGSEVLREAITRLQPTLIEDFKEELYDLIDVVFDDDELINLLEIMLGLTV